MAAPWRREFMDDRAFPSCVMGPRDLAPLAREAALRASEMLIAGMVVVPFLGLRNAKAPAPGGEEALHLHDIPAAWSVRGFKKLCC